MVAPISRPDPIKPRQQFGARASKIIAAWLDRHHDWLIDLELGDPLDRYNEELAAREFAYLAAAVALGTRPDAYIYRQAETWATNSIPTRLLTGAQLMTDRRTP